MLSSNYINTSGGKLIRTKDDNYIKLFQVNTISSVVKDKVDIYAYRIYNHTGDTFAYQDYLLIVKSLDGVSSCKIFNFGAERSVDISMKVLKEDETYTVCGRGYNSWQDISCQIIYSTNPSNIDYLVGDDYILTSELNEGETYEPSDTSSFNFSPSSKIFVDTASFHNDISVKFGYAVVNLGLYTQGDTIIENGTVIGTLPIKPYSKPLISNMTWYTILTDNYQYGVCPIVVDTTGQIIAKASVPVKCRLGINLYFKIN